MIERFQCLPRKITRRGFGMALGAAVGAELLSNRKAQAAGGSPFTLAMVPDPQNLSDSFTCSGATIYNRLISWAVDNKNLSVNGVPLNIKGFLQVGDCVQTGASSSYSSPQVISVNAFKQATDVGMFFVPCAGNHDYDTVGAGFNRSTVGYMWRNDKNGAWSPTNLATLYGSGMDLGGGDVAYWGGAYADPSYPISTANCYMRLNIQGRKILVISVEFFPRSPVMVWARGLHDAYPDHECFILTHAYQTNSGARCSRTDTWGNNNYTLGSAPISNSGIEMWDGSDASWSGLKTWPNLTGVFCGHWIDGYASPSASNWVWQRLASTSTSSRAQTVQQVFCNCQGYSPNGTGDTQNPCGVSAADVAHLMLLRITPSTGRMESFLVSTNSGKWTGAFDQGVNNTSPVQLFDVSFPSIPTGLFPLPASIRR